MFYASALQFRHRQCTFDIASIFTIFEECYKYNILALYHCRKYRPRIKHFQTFRIYYNAILNKCFYIVSPPEI